MVMSSLVGSTMASFISQFSMTVNQLSEKLGAGQEIILFSEVLKSFSIVIGMLISGVIYKRLKLKKTFLLAMALLLLPQFSIAYSPNVFTLMVLKILQGFATIIFPVYILVIIQWMEANHIGFATAMFNGIFCGGSGLGAIATGFIIPRLGWEASYLILGIISLMLGIIWFFTIDEKNQNNTESVGSSGTIRATYIEMVKKPEIWLLVLGLLGSTWALQAVAVDMPIFGEYIGYGAEDIGKIMASTTIGTVIASLISGKVSDMYSQRTINKVSGRIFIMMLSSIIIFIFTLLIIVLDLNNFYIFYILALFISFGGAWGLGSFYSIFPEMFRGDMLEIAPGFAGGIADISVPLAPFVVGIVFGARGLWSLGWLSCTIMSGLSLIACIFLLSGFGKRKINENHCNGFK